MNTSAIEIGTDALNIGLVQARGVEGRSSGLLSHVELAGLVATRIDEFPEIDVEILLAGIQHSLGQCQSVDQFKAQFMPALCMEMDAQQMAN